MPQVWIYGIGDQKNAALTLDLPVTTEPWRPFVSEQERRGEHPVLVLLFGASVGEDGLVLCHALALHEAGRATVIPVFLAEPVIVGNTMERDHCRFALECLRKLSTAIAPNGSPIPALLRAIESSSNRAKPSEAPTTVDVFYSYAHQDESLRDELAKHLKALERSRVIHQWHDRCILPGAEWAREIDINLHTADIVLLLVSPDFLASDYCQDIELPIALERHKRRSARVVPVILRPALWQHSELKWLAVLPKDGRPVALWESQDAAFLSVCQGITSIVYAWKSEGAKPLPPAPSPAVREEVERKRALDAALPDRVPLGKSVVLVGMLRRLSSPGLKAVLEANLTYGIGAEEVRSEPVLVRFTSDAAGKLQPRSLTLRVKSPDFTPPSNVDTITVPPYGDSEPCVFLLAAAKPGELKVVLELWDQERRIATCLLGTTATVEEETAIRPRPSVVSAVFDVESGAEMEEEKVREFRRAAAMKEGYRGFDEALASTEAAPAQRPGPAAGDEFRAELRRLQERMERKRACKEQIHRLAQQRQFVEALRVAESGMTEFPDDLEIASLRAMLMDELNERTRVYRRAPPPPCQAPAPPAAAQPPVIAPPPPLAYAPSRAPFLIGIAVVVLAIVLIVFFLIR